MFTLKRIHYGCIYLLGMIFLFPRRKHFERLSFSVQCTARAQIVQKSPERYIAESIAVRLSTMPGKYARRALHQVSASSA